MQGLLTKLAPQYVKVDFVSYRFLPNTGARKSMMSKVEEAEKERTKQRERAELMSLKNETQLIDALTSRITTHTLSVSVQIEHTTNNLVKY